MFLSKGANTCTPQYLQKIMMRFNAKVLFAGCFINLNVLIDLGYDI